MLSLLHNWTFRAEKRDMHEEVQTSRGWLETETQTYFDWCVVLLARSRRFSDPRKSHRLLNVARLESGQSWIGVISLINTVSYSIWSFSSTYFSMNQYKLSHFISVLQNDSNTSARSNWQNYAGLPFMSYTRSTRLGFVSPYYYYIKVQ